MSVAYLLVKGLAQVAGSVVKFRVRYSVIKAWFSGSFGCSVFRSVWRGGRFGGQPSEVADLGVAYVKKC